MIKEPPILTIRRHFARPERESLEALRGVPTAFVVDAMDGRGALDCQIKPLLEQTTTDNHIVGPALTCHCGPGDNLSLCAAVSMVQSGDVLVTGTDGFDGTCVTGDILLTVAKKNGAVGFVTDGLVRDVGGILEVGIPVYCRGVTPNSPVRSGPGTIGLDITLGGVTIASGDIVVADRDGVVVVPQRRLPEVLSRIDEVKKLEADMAEAVKNGKIELKELSAILDSDRVHYID